MSYATLIGPEEAPRINFKVKIGLESEKLALNAADKLEKLAEEIKTEEGGGYCWAKELAEIIRNQ